MPADLAQLQHAFAAALIELTQVDSLLPNFKGDRERCRDQFSRYRGNGIALWQQTCASAYPVLKQLVGNDFFDDLARAYGIASASDSGNLAEFGSRMGEFIATLENCRHFPYLADVARLEWLVHRSYYLQYNEPVTLADLSRIPPENLPDLRLQLQPCVFLMPSAWAVADIWQAHQQSNPTLPDDIEQESPCLVWRESWQSSWKVNVTSLTSASYSALKALSDGQSLGFAIEMALASQPDFSIQAELANWFTLPIFSQFNLESNH